MRIKTTVVCVDAGFRNMGFAVFSLPKNKFVETLVLSPGKGNFRYVAESDKCTIDSLAGRLATIIGERKPLVVLSEMPTGASQNAKSARCMGAAFAIVASTCRVLDVPLVMIKPSEVKKLVDPEGAKSRKKINKAKVIAYVSSRYGTKLLPSAKSKAEHVADACACLDVWRQRHYGK
jgi:Holliday junction resolvasome RuvABC endonuclease subunit